MKALIAVLALCAGFAVNARPDASDSWRTLGRTNRVIFRMPQVRFGGLFTRVNNTCVAGDKLRTKKMIKRCTRYVGRNDNCAAYSSSYRFIDLEGTRTRCVRWQDRGDDTVCTRYEDVPYSIATEYEIPVYRRRSAGDNGDEFEVSSRFRPLFTKNFTIPSCN